MESAGWRRLLENAYRFEPRGAIQVKGKSEMDTWLLVGKRDDPAR